MISKITLENFKFFKTEEKIELDNKNLLIYGENGSGKSSIYWSLYTLLESSIKSKSESEIYFNENNSKSLLNKYLENKESNVEIEINNKTSNSYYIRLKNKDGNLSFDSNTDSDNRIKEMLHASDFINYKILSEIYNVNLNEDIDLFKYFVKEIFKHILLPQTNSYNGQIYSNLKEMLKVIITQNKPQNKKFQLFKDYEKLLNDFNNEINNLIENINSKINDYLNYFNETNINVTLKFSKLTYTKNKKYELNLGTIKLEAELKYDGHKKQIKNPQAFFNEAKLTSIALAIRFSILENRLQKSELKILVLDDLLVSLDMSKRMQTLKIIEDKFIDYQKIILTHDKAFFKVVRDKYEKLNSWKHIEIYVNSYEHKPYIQKNENLLTLSEKYCNGSDGYRVDLGASANYLRKACEEILINNLKNKDLKLEDMLNFLENKFFYNKTKEILTSSLLNGQVEESILKIKEKSEEIKNGYSREYGAAFGVINAYTVKIKDILEECEQLQDKINKIKSIRSLILNPGSHHDIKSTIFRDELREAITSVKELKEFLASLNIMD